MPLTKKKSNHYRFAVDYGDKTKNDSVLRNDYNDKETDYDD